jgi:hypothetical protein
MRVIAGYVVLLGNRMIFHRAGLEIQLGDLDILRQAAILEGREKGQFLIVTKQSFHDGTGEACFEGTAGLGDFQAQCRHKVQ